MDADAIAVLPKCMNDLLHIGIPKENITVYDLHAAMGIEELIKYDAIYVCGGCTSYLLSKVNEQGFNHTLQEYLKRGGVYVGVSAGSCIVANNLENNLGILGSTLRVHQPKGTQLGIFTASDYPELRLTDNQAIQIVGDVYKVIGI